MIPPLYKWYPMVQPGGEPNRTDALERRAEKLTEDYKQALNVKKAQRNKLSLEIFTNRKLDIYV